ncbi:MAG TPA: gamma-glutamyl-gamma-aminobutyrate hydrolase [Solibacterales bacterium]|nr:gamma-glutamyl-gamma-aminobutyrate hydrolase [Bryobacterales bacterium]
MPAVALTFSAGKKAPPYREALRRVGLEPFDITPSAPRAMDGLDGLVLSGGSDFGDDDARDELEAACLQQALAARIPVLGICRGLQMMNIVLGGKLRKHVDNHRFPGVDRVHTIDIVPGSRLASIFQGAKWAVNSRHHQALEPLAVAKGFRVTASAPDKVIEAAELEGEAFVVGVQWHPEDRIDTGDLPLFEAFAEAVRKAVSTPRSHRP